MTDQGFDKRLTVHAHAAVIGGDRVGFVRHARPGHWELHASADTVDDALEPVTLESLLSRDPTLQDLESLPARYQAWRSDDDDEFESARIPTGPTWCFYVEVSLDPRHPDYTTLGGAFVNCWVRTGSKKEAVATVKRELAEEFWIVDTMDDPDTHTIANYADDDENREYFLQAQTDGEVFVFHTWPLDDEED